MNTNPKTNIATGIKQNLLLVILAVVYWILALLGPWELFGITKEAVRPIMGLASLSFVLIHGIRRYGWKNMFIWFGITFVITWSTETQSIATGFPFGNYHYTDRMGVKLGTVPLAIMPAYFNTGYYAWTMGTIFLGNLGSGIEKRNLFLVPFIAGFIMVMWNFCFDPILSTIRGTWLWENGGPYYGVPISNYFGWYLTVFLVYLVFALCLYKFSRNESLAQSKTYWYLAPLMFLGISLEYLLNPFTESTDLEIYWSMFLGAIFTMVFASILNIVFVKRLNEKWFET